jgi:hypothetical protein
MMTNARPPRRRLQFEALEERLALSVGGAALHGQGAEVLAKKIPKTIPIVFSYHESITSGSSVQFTDVVGKLGKIHLTGQGSGTSVGDHFDGGSVVLGNNSGIITIELGPAITRHVGKDTKATFAVIAEISTGAFIQVRASVGSVKVVIPDKIGATSMAKGAFNSFDIPAAEALAY